MKITLIAALGLLALVGCVSTTKTSQSSNTVCSAEYRPHLCLVEIEDVIFGGYGTNLCQARKKLAVNLERAGINAPEDAVKCGELVP